MFFFYKYRMIYHLHSMCIQYISNIPSFPLIIPHSSHCNHPFLPHNMLHCHNRNRFLVMAMLRVHHPQSLPWASAWDSYIYIYIQLNDFEWLTIQFFLGERVVHSQSIPEWMIKFGWQGRIKHSKDRALSRIVFANPREPHRIKVSKRCLETPISVAKSFLVYHLGI